MPGRAGSAFFVFARCLRTDQPYPAYTKTDDSKKSIEYFAKFLERNLQRSFAPSRLVPDRLQTEYASGRLQQRRLHGHTVIIDRQGRVVADLEGNQFSAKQLGDLIQATLARP